MVLVQDLKAVRTEHCREHVCCGVSCFPGKLDHLSPWFPSVPTTLPWRPSTFLLAWKFMQPYSPSDMSARGSAQDGRGSWSFIMSLNFYHDFSVSTAKIVSLHWFGSILQFFSHSVTFNPHFTFPSSAFSSSVFLPPSPSLALLVLFMFIIKIK